MTDTEKTEANALVARMMGWTQYDYRVPFTRDRVRPWCPPGKRESSSDCLDPPDLFADTPDGAWAREQARHFLVRREGLEFSQGAMGTTFMRLTKNHYGEHVVGDGQTLVEEEVSCIVSAFAALHTEEGRVEK